ncbi:unnamed protein product [Caenorhabditis angaria]|uniref:Uncharacterized protein n=1 Tax=Caenorhabditis angaria TaxID=860376 RepID=A0A9P1I5G5_9PELO|nr:unnamed protein product [Caenorhabditis angaria]
MSSILRKLSIYGNDSYSPQIRFDTGENATRIAKSLLSHLKSYSTERTPARLGDVCEKITLIWSNMFNIEKEIAPIKKFELAEEFLIRPDIMKLLLFVFRMLPFESKKKIRDIVTFIIVWCSNDAEDSSFGRSRAKFNVKIRDQLFHVRKEVMDILIEGLDAPDSIGLYNDILKLFVKDDMCLMSILDDKGIDQKSGYQIREKGCFWMIFKRLTAKQVFLEQFDVTFKTLESIEVILSSNRAAISEFLLNNWEQFSCCMNKLMLSVNYYIQSKSSQIMYDILTCRENFSIFKKWLNDKENLRITVQNFESFFKPVRMAAIKLFELFVFNPSNTPNVHQFIEDNSIILVKYFFEISNSHGYKGRVEELEDARISKIVYKLLTWSRQRPFTKEEEIEFEKDEKLQAKMLEEQTIETESSSSKSKICHEYVNRVAYHVENLREPIIFGKF